ncbi:hypothetical protein [Archangium lansingense]|uniref:Uncharacterized protein n=1 Tax=Archangium lansingense TaxID=2995310 RepID=A0ABT4AKX4_9BACT|nr:hypothetical protein [Archangium lansinium]MCY1082325.1 hypothetical protein [Archangium lansinium]
MKPTSSLKSLFGGLVLLAAPAALADSAANIALFDSKMTAARTSTSPSGSTVTRPEMVGALDAFAWDSWVDATERAHLSTKVGNATFLTGLTNDAKKYLNDFYELNDAADYGAPLSMDAVSGTPAQLYGASGPLASASRIQEGSIPYGEGVANQVTLTETYGWAFGSHYDYGYFFAPITEAELRTRLQQRTYSGTPTAAEVNGAVAYITQVSGTGQRLYISSWRSMGRGGPGESAGFVVAAVSNDRRFVRMVEVLTWAE